MELNPQARGTAALAYAEELERHPAPPTTGAQLAALHAALVAYEAARPPASIPIQWFDSDRDGLPCDGVETLVELRDGTRHLACLDQGYWVNVYSQDMVYATRDSFWCPVPLSPKEMP